MHEQQMKQRVTKKMYVLPNNRQIYQTGENKTKKYTIPLCKTGTIRRRNISEYCIEPLGVVMIRKLLIGTLEEATLGAEGNVEY